MFSQDALTVSAPDISQDFAERRNEEYRRDVTVDVQLKSARCQTGRRQCVMISATMRLVKRINRGGTSAVTIDAALGGGHV